ncbi:hypothetical protein GbCGDNIH4_7271 [Granulibacter bethesdensis CGDNIH4]|nr:hypothetical protein GbCGDNIH4_7271 [Granulibacter bethesdensis CGDNIH4]
MAAGCGRSLANGGLPRRSCRCAWYNTAPDFSDHWSAGTGSVSCLPLASLRHSQRRCAGAASPAATGHGSDGARPVCNG